MSADALSQVLDALQMRGTVYFRTDFSPPWGIEVPAYRRVARFHMVMRGACWVRVDGATEAVPMAGGDLVVIPHGARHVLADDPSRPADRLDDVLARTGYDGRGALVYGGDGGGSCQLFCGHFEYDEDAMLPVLDDLPVFLHIPNTQSLNAEWLEAILRFVSAEVLGGKAGADGIVRRLTEIVFIQVIRAFVARSGTAAGALAGMTDPHLARSLAAIHTAPDQAWTIERLAAEAGLSRSGFAERFAALIGMTPHRYLTVWRMRIARRLLRGGRQPIGGIARAVGYGSESALTRAFHRVVGETPAAYRRRAAG